MGRKWGNLRKRPVKGWSRCEQRVCLYASEEGVTEKEVWTEDQSGSRLIAGFSVHRPRKIQRMNPSQEEKKRGCLQSLDGKKRTLSLRGEGSGGGESVARF